MCGILVVVGKTAALDLPACRRALSRMSWRGPDLFVSSDSDGRLFLGQTILSLTGKPAPKSARLDSRSGRWSVCFNGEIYNFKDLARTRLSDRPELASPSTTDTEVLADLHETLAPAEVAGALDGMFAYALLDRKERTLSLCRDPQGEKSLYVHEDEDRIIVSSEVGPILALAPGLKTDPQVLRDYFRTRHFLPMGRTAYAGVRELAPGSLETLDLKTLRWSAAPRRELKSLIDPARMERNARRSIDDLAYELDSLLRETVRQMLPEGRRYAAVVSGGVDSSLIARYVVSHGDPSLLVAVEHVGKDRISSDLSGFEKALGRPIRVLRVDQAPYAAEIVRCQRATASPLPSHSFVPQSLQSALVRTEGCRALFGGDGGDEVFGGYDAYLGRHDPSSRFSPSPYTGCRGPEIPFAQDDPSFLERVLANAWKDSLAAYAHVGDPQARAALAMMYCDLAYQLPAVGLRGADLMSMLWSVEARSVFLRRPVLAFALNLPLAAKLDPAAEPVLRTKTLLKRVFLRHFPKELLVEKQGFAGFPNESAAYLGDPGDYLAIARLGIRPEAPLNGSLSKAAAWKLANVEYFLREAA